MTADNILLGEGERVELIWDEVDKNNVMYVYKEMLGSVIIDFANETQATPTIVNIIVDDQDRPIVLVSDTNTLYNWDQIVRVRKTV
jgi:hypothetical protein